MAQMIPPQYDESTSSAAERRLFELLKFDPETKDWVVLHSLGLVRRGRKPYGEIDFVICIPNAGVFCIEVKGGRISCQEGVWTTTNRNEETETLKRSPFLQAREGMFALRESVIKQTSGLYAKTVFGYAVVIPDVPFDFTSPEWEPWQVIDKNALKKPISHAVGRLASETRSMHRNLESDDFSSEKLIKLRQILRPDFEVVVTRGAQIEDTETRLLRLTEEQFVALDLLSLNDRCLFEGSAGTGKTMLALEYAKRQADLGQEVLLVCFNRLLGNWFERQVATFTSLSRIQAGRFYKLLREAIVNSSVRNEFLEKERLGQTVELYEQYYPLLGQLAVEEQEHRFDVCVVDEAQDLLKTEVLDVIGSWLKGGLVSGKWAFFADFEKQAIFGSGKGPEMKALLSSCAPSFVRGRLTLNCRNTRNIGEETAMLSGFDSPPYRMGNIRGLPVDYRFYATAKDQQIELREVLLQLLNSGVRSADIKILSRSRLSNSGIAGIEGGNDFRILEIDEAMPARSRVPIICFATIQAYKGMESPVIVLVDVETLHDRDSQSLFYVGMSRARSHLTILADEKTRAMIGQLAKRRLQNEWGISR